MTKRFTISKLIIKGIEEVTEDQDLQDLAREILRFELNNWKKDRPRFVASYEALIERTVRRRQKSRED